MDTILSTTKWAERAQITIGTLAIAGVINVILLLLIASLVNCRDVESEPMAQLRPIDFIKLPPKPKPKPPPPEKKKIVEKPPEPEPKLEHKPPPKKPVKKIARHPKKVAAPKLDIPLDGKGAAFENVAGKDSRITAPPTKWDIEQKPKPSGPVLTSRLIAVSRVMPVYPWRAKAMGVEGWVKIEIIVDTQGSVSRVSVIEDSPKNMFGEAAINAIKQWRFKPAFIDGEPVEQRAIQTMEFRLRS